MKPGTFLTFELTRPEGWNPEHELDTPAAGFVDGEGEWGVDPEDETTDRATALRRVRDMNRNPRDSKWWAAFTLTAPIKERWGMMNVRGDGATFETVGDDWTMALVRPTEEEINVLLREVFELPMQALADQLAELTGYYLKIEADGLDDNGSFASWIIRPSAVIDRHFFSFATLPLEKAGDVEALRVEAMKHVRAWAANLTRVADRLEKRRPPKEWTVWYDGEPREGHESEAEAKGHVRLLEVGCRCHNIEIRPPVKAKLKRRRAK